jgi:hypothetical protein
MRGFLLWSGVLTWLAASLGIVVWSAAGPRPSADTAAQHRLLHIGCPPGSHGAARADGVGRSLMEARGAARANRAQEP